MNAAFEDCTVLSRCLIEDHWDWERAAARYEALRKEHADALADLCVANFREMRDRVASPLFVLGKRLEILLHRLFPRWYLPLYTMIEFTRIPYADAVRRARAQNVIVALITLTVVCLLVVIAVLLSRTLAGGASLP